MNNKIGINPNTWALDDVPELSNFTDIARCLGEASSSGYAGIEMGVLLPRTAEELDRVLANYGLQLVSGWFDGRLLARGVADEFAAVLPHIEMLKNMGCTCVVYADTTNATFSDRDNAMSNRPRLREDQWAKYASDLTELAKRMSDFGVSMAFHQHIGTVVESDIETDRLMENTGSEVGLLLDTGHSMLAGGDPVALAARHASRIVHVHCKDVRPAVLGAVLKEDYSFISAVLANVFTVPGDGCIDYPSIFKSLRAVKYCGWLVVEAEQDLRVSDPLTYARLGFKNLTRLALEAGMSVSSRICAKTDMNVVEEGRCEG